MCIDVGICDLYYLRDKVDDYRLIKTSMKRLELTCTAADWGRGPYWPAFEGNPEPRPTFAKAHQLMLMAAMGLMSGSKLNCMSDISKVPRSIHFVLEQNNEVKVSSPISVLRLKLTVDFQDMQAVFNRQFGPP